MSIQEKIAEKLASIAANSPRVYEAGERSGVQVGTDEMWDNIQNYGNRTNLRYFLADTAFTHIDPKYFIKATNAEGIFGGSVVETVNWEKFDLSSVASLYNAFGFCSNLRSIDTELGLSVYTATLLNSVFRNCTSLVRVKKITAYPAAVWKDSFTNCTELVEIIFAGTIGANGLDVHWSKDLNKPSLTSIINAYATDISLSVTLSRDAVKKAFETSEGANDGDTSEEWNSLIATKPNLTIAYQ